MVSSSSSASHIPPRLPPAPSDVEYAWSLVEAAVWLWLLLVYLPYQLILHLVVPSVQRLLATLVVTKKKNPTTASTIVNKDDDAPTTNDPSSPSSSTSWWIILRRHRPAVVVWLVVVAVALAAPWHHDIPSTTRTFRNDHAATTTGLYELIRGTDDAFLDQILQRVPDLTKGPQLGSSSWFSALLRNPHLQFVPWLLQNEWHRQFRPIPYQRLYVNVTDCRDKTQFMATTTTTTTTTTAACRDHPDAPRLTETLTLDVFPPFTHVGRNGDSLDHCADDDDAGAGAAADHCFSRSPHAGSFDDWSSPIVWIAPGLRCHSQDIPGTTLVRQLYGAGFRSVVVHRRGHTPDHGVILEAPRWNLLGDVDDMEQVYWHMVQLLLLSLDGRSGDRRCAPHESMFHHNNNQDDHEQEQDCSGKDDATTDLPPMFLYGVSSGTGVAVTAVTKWDRRNTARQQQLLKEQPSMVDAETGKANNNNNNNNNINPSVVPPAAPQFVAAAYISPGYDLARLFSPERFLYPYNVLLTGLVQDHFVRQNEALLRAYNSTAVDAVLRATWLQEFVNASVPFAGYPDMDTYLRDINPINHMTDITTTPVLVLNAVDDPCCSIQNLYDTSPYDWHDGRTYADLIRRVARVLVAVARTGSHCPFLDGGGEWHRLIVRDPVSGGWMLNSWADRMTVEYFQATLELYRSSSSRQDSSQ